MKKIKRRTVIKSIGAVGLGVPLSSFSKQGEENFDTDSNERLTTEILVVGGGTAGTIAAIQAGRSGCRTVLIECGSQLGGTVTTGGVSFPGIFHAWGKQIIGGIGWELVRECVELNGDSLPDFTVIPNNTTIRHWKHQVAVNSGLYTMLAEEKCINAGVDIRYYETPTRVELKKGKWLVTTEGKGTKAQITCNQIIDCTGNALVASMAGYNVLKEDETQPGSLVYSIGGYDYDALDLNKIPKKYHSTLRQNMLVNPAENEDQNKLPLKVPYNYVYVPGADSTTSVSHTKANIQGRATLLNLIRELKTLPGCENIRLEVLKTETAVRETYRIDGLYQITREDYLAGKDFEDAVSYSFYPVDLHRDGKKIYQEFLEPGVVAKIPLRALIPKNSTDFLVAGRCVSSDRMANSALRVQASCMGMGQAAAATAVLASKSGQTPAEVPFREIQKLLAKHAAILPDANI